MIFVDESIQHSLGYICVGFAYCESLPDEEINQAISHVGMIQGVDEYKSGYRMSGSKSRQELREAINKIVMENCRLGIYIAPVEERSKLLTSIAKIAEKIVQINMLDIPQVVFVDEGIDGDVPSSNLIIIEKGCDSRFTPGIQLADYVAYHCSYLMKCALSGISKKIILSKDEVHPLAGDEVEFDWMLRTELRRHFFVEPRNIEEINGDDWFFKLAGYGAFFSPILNEKLKNVAKETFDSMYFGCVW